MKFPLADWIDLHAGCRHNLGESGMKGSIRHPLPTAREVRDADAEELRRALSDDLGVEPRRVFLTAGATEANAAVLRFLARPGLLPRRSVRVRTPEYPPLSDAALAIGFALRPGPGRTGVGLLSQPRNPEGDLWERARLLDWAEGADHLVVDETFREFARARSLVDLARPRVWVTGSFTKFYAGDDFRVGFLVAPEELAGSYGRDHGLLVDELARHSVASALVALRARASIRTEVDRILGSNRAAWRRAFPRASVPVGPVGFDRTVRPDGDTVAARCLRASVLVCPGSLFGDPTGVRVGLTRRTFPADLGAYLAARNPAEAATPNRPNRSTHRAAPRRPGGSGRARGGRA